jgi:photosystem II stability/assembly factor-like uncharacterized protein
MVHKNKLIKTIFFSLLILLNLQPTVRVSAGINIWTGNGPEGGTIYALAIDPSSPATVYAGTSGNGVFKSTNGGGSWSAINSGITSLRVNALAIDPTSPATVYAGTSGVVFKSTNGGGSWSAFNTGLSSTIIYAMAIDPSNPATLYAGTNNGVFKSTNGGGIWSAAGTSGTSVFTLAIDPSSPATVYAGTSGGVFKSTNGGGNWSAVNTGLTTEVRSLAIDPSSPATLYAGTMGGGVFKSANGGGSWSAINTGLPNTFVEALAIDPSNPATLYAGTGLGVSKSTNAGGSWTDLTDINLFNINALVIDPAYPVILYAGTYGSGILKSTNGNESWSIINTGLTAADVRSLAIDPSSPRTLYTGTWGSGIFKSTDAGGSWSAANTGLTGLTYATFVYFMVIDPSDPATLYAGTYEGSFKSTNGGGSWSTINSGLTDTHAQVMAVDPSNTVTLYAGTDGGIFKSTNCGGSWSAINTGLTSSNVLALAINPSNTATLYAGTNSGVFKSTNGGGNWSAAGMSGTVVYTLAIDPSDPATLYVGTGLGVSKSTNGGGSWNAVNAGLTNSYVITLAIDPSSPATLYAGTNGGGVFKSANGGGSWSAINTGLTNTIVEALAIDPSNPATLYAGTDGSGVFAIQQVPPGSFSKSSPANGASGLATNPTLSWGASSGATSYEYCYATFTGCTNWTTVGNTTSVGLSGLANNTTYYWQVRSVNAGGNTLANSGTYWYFTTIAAPPGAFSKSSPANAVTGVATNPTLSWGTSNGATSYEYCYATSTDCNNWTSVGTNTSVALSGLSNNQTYYWQVRAVNASGNTQANGGTYWSFTTIMKSPDPFSKSSPGNGTSGVATNPTLSWGASTGATSYEYCYATSTGCTSWTSVGNASSVVLSGLSNNQTYYWQVRAVNPGGSTLANTDAYWYFTTVVAGPGAFGKSLPGNGATGLATNPTLSWGSSNSATAYQYCYATTTGCTNWISVGTNTSVALSGLSINQTYYWQVRAANANGNTLADAGSYWHFTTIQKFFLPLALKNYNPYPYFEVEPNNDPQNATGPLLFSQDYHGFHNDGKDYFSINIPADGNISIYLTGVPSQGMQLQLYDQSLNPLIMDYDADQDGVYKITYSVSAGIYYICVFTTPENYNTDTPYTLRVTYP